MVMLFNGYIKVLHLAYEDYAQLARVSHAFGMEKRLEQSPQCSKQYVMQCENLISVIFLLFGEFC